MMRSAPPFRPAYTRDPAPHLAAAMAAVDAATERREKVAEALWVSLLGKHRNGRTWSADCPAQHRAWWLAQADAAIAAMDAVAPAPPELMSREDAIRAAEEASSARPAEAIVGDWTGEASHTQETAAADLAHLRSRVRSLYAEVLRRREKWANNTDNPAAAARAVAYQSIGGLLQRAIEDNEKRSAS